MPAGFAADQAEPTYKDKPISYWIGGLLSAPPNNAPELLDSIIACGEIGWKGMPYLLKEPWITPSGILDRSRPARLNAIVFLYSKEDKKKVGKSLYRWLKSSDVQTRAVAVALRPSNPAYMLVRRLERVMASDDPLIRLAVEFKTRQPLEAGWEQGYEPRISPATPQLVVTGLLSRKADSQR